MTEIAGGKLLVERDGPVATVVMNRPEVKNALDKGTAAAWPRSGAASSRTKPSGPRC